jgi:hypothetical protein
MTQVARRYIAPAGSTRLSPLHTSTQYVSAPSVLTRIVQDLCANRIKQTLMIRLSVWSAVSPYLATHNAATARGMANSK